MLLSFRGCVLESSFLLARANTPVSLQQVFQDERYQVRASGPNIGPENGGFLDVIGPHQFTPRAMVNGLLIWWSKAAMGSRLGAQNIDQAGIPNAGAWPTG